MPNRWVVILVCLILIAACAPAPTPSPTLQVARIVTTSAFESTAAEWAATFAFGQQSVLMEIEIMTPQAALKAIDAGEADVIIAGVKPPQGWFASPLWVEGIAVVVHPSNSARRLSTDDLISIFTGRITTWSELKGENWAIQPIVPFSGDDLRAQFETQVLNDAPVTPNALLAPNPSAMASMVAEDEGAIGILPFSYITPEVLTVIVDGIIPTVSNLQNGLYPLSIEVLALAPEEPVGVARDWLAWMQSLLP